MSLTESDPPQPTDAYGRSKLAAEAFVRGYGVPSTILRPVVVYGTEARANMAQLIRIASLPFPLPFGAFANRRSLLALDNMISAIRFVLDTPATAGETYIVSDPSPVSLADMIATLRKARGRSPAPASGAAGMDRRGASRRRQGRCLGADRHLAGGGCAQAARRRLAAADRYAAGAGG